MRASKDCFSLLAVLAAQPRAAAAGEQQAVVSERWGRLRGPSAAAANMREARGASAKPQWQPVQGYDRALFVCILSTSAGAGLPACPPCRSPYCHAVVRGHVCAVFAGEIAGGCAAVGRDRCRTVRATCAVWLGLRAPLRLCSTDRLSGLQYGLRLRHLPEAPARCLTNLQPHSPGACCVAAAERPGFCSGPPCSAAWPGHDQVQEHHDSFVRGDPLPVEDDAGEPGVLQAGRGPALGGMTVCKLKPGCAGLCSSCAARGRACASCASLVKGQEALEGQTSPARQPADSQLHRSSKPCQSADPSRRRRSRDPAPSPHRLAGQVLRLLLRLCVPGRHHRGGAQGAVPRQRLLCLCRVSAPPCGATA